MSSVAAGQVTELGNSLSLEIPELLTEHRLPGLAIAIFDASDVLWSAAFGVKKAGEQDPVTTDTIFSLQSISKLYTATVVMLAVQDELVELDVPITHYLPEFQVRSAFETHPEHRMTLRHLLGHTAGFTHEAPVGNNYVVGKASFTAHCRSIAETWLRFPVGHHYEYSNLGIDLAAYIVQRRRRLSFHEFARRRLFVPLGLQRTSFDDRVIAHDRDRALGHAGRHRRLPVRVPMVGAGGVYASVLDAARFAQLHVRSGDPLLDPRYAGEMCAIPFAHSGQVYGYGLGVASLRMNGLPVRGHSGGGFGFLSDLYWSEDGTLGVAVLMNSVDHPLQLTFAGRVLNALIPAAAPAPDLPHAYPQAAGAMAGMIGEYVGRGGRLTIATEGSQLLLIAGDERSALRVTAPDEVVVESRPDERFRILPGEDGATRYLLHVPGGAVWYRNDRPQSGPISDAWEGYAGEYAITMHGVRTSRMKLVAEGGSMRLVRTPEEACLWLAEHEPGLLYSTMGEVLDLTRDPPTYANIELHRIA